MIDSECAGAPKRICVLKCDVLVQWESSGAHARSLGSAVREAFVTVAINKPADDVYALGVE